MKSSTKISKLQDVKGWCVNTGIVMGLLIMATSFRLLTYTLSVLLVFDVILIMYLKSKIKNIRIEGEYKKIAVLRTQCLNKIKYIENLFTINGFSIDIHENFIIESIYETLNVFCVTVETYSFFLKELDLRIEYVNDFIERRKRWSYGDNINESFYRNTSRYSKDDTTSKYLGILGLPEDTTDFEKVKTAYRGLMVKYHPDKHNLSGEAEKAKAHDIAQNLNEAYLELEKILKVS